MIADGPFGEDRYTTMWLCPKCRYVNAKDNKTCGSCLWKMSDGGCFLTTTVVEVLGMEDNCRELSMMRKLRSEYLLEHEEGRAIMADYYAKSNAISQGLNLLSDKKAYCQNIMDNHIKLVAGLVEKGAYQSATEMYLEMVDEVMDNLKIRRKDEE